ncbi:hypothetical protein BH23GEM3_BH23GEM3_19660 [soil metagenome]
MLYYVIFFFVALGAKLLFALVTIYLLFPAERSCNECDGETLLLQMGAGGRMLSRLCLGALQRRWCPACRWEGFTRRGPAQESGAAIASGPTAPTSP